MDIPRFDEARLDALTPDMQFAVLQHDDIHAGLAEAFKVANTEGAMALLEQLTDVVDNTPLKAVFGATRLHEEVITTAQLISTNLAPGKRIQHDLERIVEARTERIQALRKGPVGDAVYLGSTAIQAS
jgi:hypothetical protein